MAMTKEQEAFIRQTAWKVGDTISERLCEKIDDKINTHAAECKVARMEEVQDTGERASGRFWQVFAVLVSVTAVVIAIMTFWWRVSRAAANP